VTTSTPRGKPVTRRTLLSRRDALTAEQRVEASALIAIAATRQLEGLAAGRVVALYAAKGSEVETVAIDAAARERGLVVVYPRVEDGDRVLSFSAVGVGGLTVARYGLREPAAGEAGVPLDQIALFFVPGVAFDRAGGRIGWGRGHYDATFAKAGDKARRVGLAFECQIVERIEREAHDAPMHVIVTEVTTHVV
jgi:5-formyltetrahydrofolate cyclo-ligase